MSSELVIGHYGLAILGTVLPVNPSIGPIGRILPGPIGIAANQRQQDSANWYAVMNWGDASGEWTAVPDGGTFSSPG